MAESATVNGLDEPQKDVKLAKHLKRIFSNPTWRDASRYWFNSLVSKALSRLSRFTKQHISRTTAPCLENRDQSGDQQRSLAFGVMTKSPLAVTVKSRMATPL